MKSLTEQEVTCCFTGHRPEKLNISEDVVIQQLNAAILDALRDGYTTFISGGAKGVDLWAGELVLRHRQARPDIKLVCALPFEGFGLHWGGGWTERFKSVLQSADEVRYVCPGCSRSAYQRRNRYMVDHSSRLIAAYTGAGGGTQNTIEYARRKGGCQIVLLQLSCPPVDGKAQ